LNTSFPARRLRRFLTYAAPVSPVAPDHPLFRLEPALARELAAPGKLSRETIKIILVMVSFVAVFWILTDHADDRWGIYPGWYLTRPQQELNFLSFVAGTLVEVTGLVVTIDSFQMKHTHPAQWELLRLTPLTADRIAVVKYISSLVRVWRVAAVVVGLRLGVLLMMVLDWTMSGGWRDLSGDRLLTAATTIALTLLALLYVSAPFWHARLITLWHLNQSARYSNTIVVIFMALGSFAGFWIKSLLVIASFCLFTVYPIVLFTPGKLVIVAYIYFMAAVALWIVYSYYKDAHQQSLDDLRRYLNEIF
jgi:hypothetical protein